VKEPMLNDKVAVVYGAGGAVSGARPRAFASERREAFLAGRNLAPQDPAPDYADVGVRLGAGARA
jgi:3-oxoacyl-[acyl-carrier protein] reductase